MKNGKAFITLSRAVVTTFCITAVACPQTLLACMGSAGPVCNINPAACLKSMVLTKSVPGPIFPIPPAGTGTLVVSNNLFITCPITNNCGNTCTTVGVPVSASLTVTLSPPPPPACPPGSPILSATISTAGATMTLPACSPAGTFNPYLVAVSVPGGTCPGLYTVVGTATVTFSDGTVLTQTGDTVICLVPEAPGQPGVPRLNVELLTPSFPRMAPGDQHLVRYRITNNDPSNSVTLTAFATSRQAAVRPQGGNEAQGVFAISSPFGDDFPIMFNAVSNICIPLPSHPYTQPTISNSLPVIGPGQSNIVTVGIRSYGQCASGSCSESTLRVEGNFSDSSPALGCASMALSVDSSLPSQSCAQQVNDCNGNGIPDAVDIARRTSQDQNFNALPDECEQYISVPFFSSVSPNNPSPGAPIQVQVAFNEVFSNANVWANGNLLARTQSFGSPLWYGTIPADTRPGPQTVYFLGKDTQGGLASYIALYTVQGSAANHDFAAADLQFTPVGGGLYDVQPVVDADVSETAFAEVPIDYQILINGVVQYDSRMHGIKAAGNRCIQPGCITPVGGCQVMIHNNIFNGTCVIRGGRCFCTGRYNLWPGLGLPIPNGSLVRLVVDPDNVVPELDEDNNDLYALLQVPPVVSITKQGTNVQLSWTPEGVLQAAGNVTGPFANVANISPFLTSPTASAQFFRAFAARQDIYACNYNVTVVTGPANCPTNSVICVVCPSNNFVCPNINSLTLTNYLTSTNVCKFTVSRQSPQCHVCDFNLAFSAVWVGNPTNGVIRRWP